ncbi:MAG: DNA mismatch repair protein MutS [Thermoguttaceae bacterium]|nr:DNA mismatch repair protein MutS [Thermoguttaceae bacterium]MDW8078622.1 DNA mismatch repair protein MutS [Thermoguttaceae bacterium]
MSENLTPMMKQYMEAKQLCPDALLLFRMGDFYELFFEDAKVAARTLGIALTSREKGPDAPPMAGFPYHQLDTYLARLIAAGFRVAICEQVEDPREAKGLVRREITRIVSPGTITEELLLDPRRSNYLVALWLEDSAGIAWAELTTGAFFAGTVPRKFVAEQLARLMPAECLLPESMRLNTEEASSVGAVTKRPDWSFSLSGAIERLTQQFGTVNLEGFGFDHSRDAPALRAAGALVDYLWETQKTSLQHIDRLLPFRLGQCLEIDPASRHSLEIIRTAREGRREGSLLGVLDRCVTPMGSRLLAEWLSSPLVDVKAINDRLDAVQELVSHPQTLQAIRDKLRSVCDIERLLTRAITGRAGPRDLRTLAESLQSLPEIRESLGSRESSRLQAITAAISPCPELASRLLAALEDNCPSSPREGGFIRGGYSPELDELRAIGRGGKDWIARYQAEESARTGIPNLRVGYNKVFGYYIEVTKSYEDKVPAHYIRKQTIKNAERYVTPELKAYEEKVLSAEEKSRELEYELFLELRSQVVEARHELKQTAAALAELDVYASLADLAIKRRYCRPRLVDEPVLHIVEGRHPVLDAGDLGGRFVPNDTHIDETAGKILVITGPNMAGKSTYIRQVALIVLMAQIGSFVPAQQATIGIADRIFARVGASDELARGQSTFMVEMLETARILNLATCRSLVILDEIGRGTSTYDGISLAWAIVEYLHDHIDCRTLFATHYHELTDLAKACEKVRNFNVAVREWGDQVVFLHKIVEGAADKSYGIHVARLAGIPKAVIERAKQLLAQLESDHLDTKGRPKLARKRRWVDRDSPYQLMLFVPASHPVLEAIRQLDVNAITPLKALELIAEWKASLLRDQDVAREALGEQVPSTSS